LVVDDDAQAREMVAVLIEKALPGLTVQFAKDGQEALDILAEAAPALVVLDLMMPKVDGFEVLERIRKNERTQSVPVIVMSGKLLTEEDARRISYARVVFHAKELLSDEEIIRVLKRAFETDDYLSPPTSALVKKSLTYMHKNYARPLTRPEIAPAIGVSESYLSEILKQEVGISFWDCLNRFRVRLAKELLLETNKNVTTIAFDVGFEDISYFNRVFNRYVGISPARYRRSKKGR